MGARWKALRAFFIFLASVQKVKNCQTLLTSTFQKGMDPGNQLPLICILVNINIWIMPEILHFSKYRFLIFCVLNCFASSSTSAQTTISGKVMDGDNKEMLPYVNIGIKHKNIGTVSAKNGSYSILIPTQNQDDTLTFSMVGYNEFTLPLRNIISPDPQTIQLKARHLTLEPARVTVKLVEKKIGLVKNHALIHFVDGSTNKNDIFEIAQLIKLDTILTKITSVNLTITEAREDSGTFRINFYGFDGLRPTGRVVETSLIQTHAIVPGLLVLDLKKYNIYLKGNIVIGIEFLPTGKVNSGRINYEVKLGGPAKSFVRTSSQGDWRVPPIITGFSFLRWPGQMRKCPQQKKMRT